MKQILRNSFLTMLFAFLCQIAICQNAPTFVKIVKNGVEMDMNNLSLKMNEGDIDSLQLYVQGAGSDTPYIVATGLVSRWGFFMSASGAGSATLVLAPDYDAQGDYTIGFETFDQNPAHSSSTVSLALTVIDRNIIDSDNVSIINFPNPFKTTTTLEFNIPKGGNKATLKIYSSSGREVMTLIDDVLISQGHYFRKIDMSAFPAGTYTYKLKVTGVGEDSGRMIKL